LPYVASGFSRTKELRTSNPEPNLEHEPRRKKLEA